MTQLIYKVLANKATRDERKLLQRWISESPEHRMRYEKLKSIWSSGQQFPEATEDDLHEEGFQKIKQKVKQKIRQKRQRQLLLTGAIALILAFVSIYITTTKGSPEPLVFQGETVERVISSIEEKYRIKIELENKSLLSCPFTGTFYAVDTPSGTVGSIADAVGARCEVLTEQKYRLVGGTCR